ncbi:hypothetical protein F3Y22_tig00110940pilonHSYRG00241 [Hibiscus syriacus]|uniref:TPX2 C-terminal domain-containing protein n=1 Tax=Hibiscus syriacus TaxID=106335 RepID=A0A6A2ZEC7_HIBSY|nr:hypothetical protein F3Y22_tig00110940pilonHSYRG00241 [Hibiscus syriacus]
MGLIANAKKLAKIEAEEEAKETGDLVEGPLRGFFLYRVRRGQKEGEDEKEPKEEKIDNLDNDIKKKPLKWEFVLNANCLDPLSQFSSSSWDSSQGSISSRNSNGGRRSRRNNWWEEMEKAAQTDVPKTIQLRTEVQHLLSLDFYLDCFGQTSVKESTRPVDLRLHSDVRAVERAEFDHQVAEKMSLIEQYKMERERQQKYDACVHDSLRHEVETTGGPFVVKLSLELDILRREVEIQRPFIVKLNLCCLESNILCCEVEIGSEIEKLFVDNQRSLRREVELALSGVQYPSLGPFIVKLNLRCLESNILRCEVEIGSEIEKLFIDNQRSLRREVELALSGVQYPSISPFVVKLNLRFLESNILRCEFNILRCEVEIGSEFGKLFVDNHRPFVVKLNLCCLEWHDILHRGVEIADGHFVVKLSLDLNILRREVEIQVWHLMLKGLMGSLHAPLLIFGNGLMGSLHAPLLEVFSDSQLS